MLQNGNPPQKIDTPERLAWAVGKDPKTYESAADYNFLLNRLTVLWAIANPNPANFHPSRKIDLGTISVPFITYLNTNTARTFLEPSFVVYKVGEIQYVYAFVGKEGTYGIGHVPLTEAQFIFLSSTDIPEPTLPSRKIAFGTLSGDVFDASVNSLGYEITVNQVDDYWLTNIPFFPTTVVRIQDPLNITIDTGGFVKASWFNQGGFVALKNVYFPQQGATSDGGEFSHAYIEFEQL
ncbi:hypothetical protein [Flavobacterium sp. N1994]|uniref:hypothetical protein n=1 Tax=Flavobacterium sp. N1994 TaxID=2986827 RepID=UPI002221F647|nr:hypothetical protein [Flavobacterium sp. N1994]